MDQCERAFDQAKSTADKVVEDRDFEDARRRCRDAARNAEDACFEANRVIDSVSKFCNARDQNGAMKNGVDWVAQQAGYRCRSGASSLMMGASAALIAATLM